MGHGAHQSAVLQNGAAAHALDNAAGQLQQVRVRYLQKQITVIGIVGVDGRQLHLEFLHPVAPDVGTDHRPAGVDLVGRCHVDGRSVRTFHGAENAAGGVFDDLPRGGAPGDGALQRPRRTLLALDDRRDDRRQDAAAAHGQQAAFAAHAVAQGAEAAGLGVIIGHGADAADAVADQNPQPPAVGGLIGRKGDVFFFLTALQRQLHRSAAGGFHRLCHLRRRGNGLSVDGADEITLPQARLFRQFSGKIHHRHAVRLQRQADGVAAGDENVGGLHGA